MLITAPTDIGSIVSIKLQSGIELIGKLHAQDATSVTISKPLVVDLTMDPQTQKVAIGMAPGFILGADWEQNVTLNRDHITTLVKSAQAMQDNYTQSTSTIALPRRSGIIQ